MKRDQNGKKDKLLLYHNPGVDPYFISILNPLQWDWLISI